MVPVSTTISCIITLFISLVLPVLALLVFALKCRKQGILSAWLLGTAGFLVTQIGIRLPILTALSGQAWFLNFSQNHLFAYAFSLAFTAGLFELVGRFVVAKLMQKRLTYNRSLAAGLGHGGIEAIFIVGMTYVNNLVYITMINSGTLFSLVAPGAAPEVQAQLDVVVASLLSTPSYIFLLAGFERLLTMIAHTAMSILVCWGVKTGKTGKCLLICLGLHTFIDLTAGISLLAGTVLSQAAAYTIIYIILTAVAVLSIFIICNIRHKWQEVDHVQ